MESTSQQRAVHATPALDALRAELLALAPDEVAPPAIPVDHQVAEAQALAMAAAEDRQDLLSVGLAAKFLDALRPRAQALADAQAELTTVRGGRRSEAEIALEDTAREYRTDLVAAGRFALRRDREAQKVIDEIQEGEGLDDLVQDLRDLAQFMEHHQEAFDRIGRHAGPAAARARKMAEELETQVAKRRGGERAEEDALRLRNRAATHLEEAMVEVRAAGVYVFRRQPRRQAHYRSAYNRLRGRRKPAQPAAPGGTGTPAAPA